MPVGRSTPSVCAPALFASLLSGALLLAPTAHADVYYPIATGDTLASVAKKYGVATDALRAANGLSSSDSTPLATMLLRVPGVDGNMPVATVLKPGQTTPPVSAAPVPTYSTPAPSFNSNSSSSKAGMGFIARTMAETVRAGDTWESIAARYRAAGYNVSANDVRRRNNWGDLPDAGETVVVPLGQTSYSTPASELPTTFAPRVDTSASSFPRTTASASVSPSRGGSSTATTPSVSAPTNSNASKSSVSGSGNNSLGGGVYASPDMDLPFATVKTSEAPVFSATNGGNATAPGRGGYGGNSFSARGGYGEQVRGAIGGEVRVLGPGEEATAPPAPQVRTATNPTALSQPPVTGAGIARVARVSARGAQIRRLPQASAVTLYRCQVGTQLAVLRQSGTWSAVLMSDRSTGWLPSSYLKITDQTVDVSTQVVANPGPGGYARYNVGRYSTENPCVAQALTWLGTRYVYGGTSRRGIDCSSLVQHSFAANGVSLPRTAAQQARVGQSIAPSELRAGDRLYFSASGTRIDHTGLYMGDGLFVHASGSGRQVMVSSLFEPRNWNIFVGAKR